MARPRKEVDWAEIDKLCEFQATEEEIAQWFGVSVDTLSRRCQEQHEMSFADYFAEKRGSGKISLRRYQWQAAQRGNPTLLIWLGKQHLGQKDKTLNELTGLDGKPIQTEATAGEDVDAKLKRLLGKLSPEEIAALIAKPKEEGNGSEGGA